MIDEEFEKIEPIPKPILIECLKENPNLIVFVGAGVSHLCGLPLWDKLANNLLDICRKRDSSLSNSEIEIVKKNYNPVEKITFASVFLGDINTLICKMLKKKNKKKKELDNKEKILKALNSFKSTIITTNADTILDEINSISPEWKIFNHLDDGSVNYSKKYPALIHMHGSVNDENSLVFTLDQYASKYSIENGFANQLREIFSKEEEKVIVFIGYGLREFQLLQYILDFESNEKVKRYIYKLDGYLASEKLKIEVDKKYYKKLGIELIHYSREQKDYDKLIDVLTSWRNEIENSVNVFQHIDNKIEQTIKEKPDKTSISYLKENISNVTDDSFFYQNLVASPFFKDWMRVLTRTDYFDPNMYFKSCKITEDNKYQSNNWYGLYAIDSYISNYGHDTFIKSLAKKVLAESAKVLKKDALIKDKYLKKNTSFSIMHFLMKIMLSNEEYLNNTSVVKTIVDSEISSPFYDSYSLPYSLYSARYVLVKANPKSVFYLYKKAVEVSKESIDYTEYLKHNEMENTIKQAPALYYNYAEKTIYELKDDFYLMGAFYNYDSIKYIDVIKAISAYYLKLSSKYIEKEMLQKSIKALIDSSNDYLKRVGLCLIGLNIDKAIDLFVNNLDEFFNEETYYSDLRILLYNNGKILSKNDELFSLIVNKINSIEYGFSEQKNMLLKKGLFKILKQFDNKGITGEINISLEEESALANYNKRIYSEPINFERIKNDYYDSIEALDVPQMVERVNILFSEPSNFFKNTLFEAIDEYLSRKNLSDYINYLRQIGADYLKHYLFEIYYGEAIKLTYEERKQITSFLNDDEYKENIDSIISIIKNDLLDEALSIEERMRLLSSFKYKLIEIPSYSGGIENNKLDLNVTHGNGFYRFFDLLVKETIKNKDAKRLLIEVYLCFKEQYINNRIFKFDVGTKYDILLWADEDLFGKDIKYYFKDCDLSQFNSLAFVDNLRTVVDYIQHDDAFIQYLSNGEFKSDYRDNVSYRLLLIYINQGKYEDLKERIVCSSSVSSFEWLFQAFWNNLSDKISKEIIERLDIFIDSLIQRFDSQTDKTTNIDRLMYVIAELINLSSNYDIKLWNLLVSLSSFKHEHYFEEMEQAIVKNAKASGLFIRKILLGYLSSFEKYGVEYYARKFIETVNVLSSYSEYHDVCSQIKLRMTGIDIKTKSLFTF